MRFSNLAVVMTSILASFGEVTEDQELDFCEVFAGCHILHSGAEAWGLRSRCLDVCYTRKMNILTNFGFILLLSVVRRIQRSGTAWYAVPCSSWIWLSRGSTHRSWVQAAGPRLEYNFRKGVEYVVENPSSSLLGCFQRHGARRVTIYLGSFGARTLKPVTLWGTASWLQQLPNTLNPSTRGTLRRIGSLLGLDVVRRYQDGRGVSRLAGGRDLRGTQAYPGSLGLTVGRLLSDHLLRVGQQSAGADAGVVFEDFDDLEGDDSELEDLV
ncbi:unnamed protein product [Effrenium voratum]|nr:unnamed protein product [Effrenium voratum]